MAKLPAARVLVDILGKEGVKTIFGLPGGHIIGILDALYDRRDIRFIRVRHEHSASLMAVAYAQLTGEPGVCLVTAGPAATNLATGIAEAHVGARPLVVLAGRGSTAVALRGDSQEIPTARIYPDHQIVDPGRSRRPAARIAAQRFRAGAQRPPGPGLYRHARRHPRSADRRTRLRPRRAADAAARRSRACATGRSTARRRRA